MELKPNIIIDRNLMERIDAGTLTLADHLRLYLADFLAGMFPDQSVYTERQKQGTVLPGWFVRIFDFIHQKQLVDTAKYTFGFELTYFPLDSLSNSELTNAAFMVLQNLEYIDGAIGPFSFYRLQSDITDGVVHVVGDTSACEINLPNGEIVQQADKELIIE